jgi:hypothetical protein
MKTLFALALALVVIDMTGCDARSSPPVAYAPAGTVYTAYLPDDCAEVLNSGMTDESHRGYMLWLAYRSKDGKLKTLRYERSGGIYQPAEQVNWEPSRLGK